MAALLDSVGLTDFQTPQAVILDAIEAISLLIEILAVGIIVVAIAYASSLYALGSRRPGAYTTYRVRLGRALGLGLEVLVAADVIRTVALQPTFGNVLVLGLLVLVRTFLSWSLVVEIEGHWPWQHPASQAVSTVPGIQGQKQ